MRASCEIVIGSGFFTRSAIARDGQRPVRRVWRMAVNPSEIPSFYHVNQ